ncbi:unnamed protein product, partial [marine sediment metagenome]
ILKSDENLNNLVDQMSKSNCDIVSIKTNTSNLRFIDYDKTFKDEDGKVTFGPFGNIEEKAKYVYKKDDKNLYKFIGSTSLCLGKFKYLNYENEKNNESIIVFSKQSV